ncbi:hypothetical protein OZX62_07425 [Bifidobacterium sp. ESL0690]|uniref:hypothetical protein n=1 Tax=Bifidobacterium sp. ESL0690 TaxID=2983214 RepID=UPI0023F9C4AB|nr:hypothetical protein [Bifidobacterium sp. ESL0690]WEV46268.1 hypothetical protein OZX62_07425 [Bifidobacterium sp. ESL0690]
MGGGFLSDGSAGVHSAAGSGGQSSGSSPSGAWSFDFTLTGPMWCRFAQASNAYGRGIRLIGVLLVLGGFAALWVGFSEYTPFEALLLAAIGLIGLLACTRSYSCWLLMHTVLWSACDWFDVPALNTRRAQETVSAWRSGNFDEHWLTSCRLLADGDGVVLLRRVRGRKRKVRASWSDLACVRLTEEAVVLSPSAGGLSGVDIIPAIADVKFADLSGCVLVDRSVVPDVDGFVSWCRGRIAAASPRLRGPRRWWRRLWSWLYADGRYLDGPPAWAANK